MAATRCSVARLAVAVAGKVDPGGWQLPGRVGQLLDFVN
jgi:hypothetical protein